MKLLLTLLFACFELIIIGQTNSSSIVINLDQDNYSNSMVKAIDNNFITVGEKLIMKFDINGNIIWNKTILQYNEFYLNIGLQNIIETNDSCYLITGSIIGVELNHFCGLYLKIDVNGNVIWSKILKDDNLDIMRFNAIQLNDSGFIMVGSIDYPYHHKLIVSKTDADGNLEWSKLLSEQPSNGFSLMSVINSSDSSIVVVGNHYSNNDHNTFAIDIHNNGTVNWSKSYNITQSDYWGLYCLGVSKSFNNFLFFTNWGMLKLNVLGNIISANTFGLCSSYYFKSKVFKLSNDRYGLLIGDEFPYCNNFIKFDSTGLVTDQCSFWLSVSDCVELTNEEFLIIGNGPLRGMKGLKNYISQIGIIKLDSTSTFEDCVDNWVDINYTDTITFENIDIFFTEDSAGYTSDISLPFGSLKCYKSYGCVDSTPGVDEINSESIINIYPNPTSGDVTITFDKFINNTEIVLYDVCMRKLFSMPISKPVIELNLSKYSKGLYFMQYKNEDFSTSQKLIIE